MVIFLEYASGGELFNYIDYKPLNEKMARYFFK